MATHLTGWYQNVDSAVLAKLNVIEDTQLTTPDVKTFSVPSELPFIHWAYAAGPSITRARIVTPSLITKRAIPEIIPRRRGSTRIDLAKVEIFKPISPIPLVPTEGINAEAAEDGAGATDLLVLVSLGPATLPALPAGELKIVRATGTKTLTPYKWTKVDVVLDEQLEAGTYTLIGFIPISAGIIAARALIVGQVYRPGVLGLPGSEADAVDFNASNYLGIQFYAMGSFSHVNIPAFEFLSATADTSETVILYLVKTG
jgi:hypothetical protein